MKNTREGNARRCARWRQKNREKYRAYMKNYMQKYRKNGTRGPTD